MDAQTKPTVGSLFAGIGGFDLGFERAGFTTSWQVEINNTCRAVLSDRFPHARQFIDVQNCLPELWAVDAIIGGFPCQDVSLSPTCGIRWLSGKERLQIMGFCADWMRPTLRKLGLPETPLCRKSRNGSHKSS